MDIDMDMDMDMDLDLVSNLHDIDLARRQYVRTKRVVDSKDAVVRIGGRGILARPLAAPLLHAQGYMVVWLLQDPGALARVRTQFLEAVKRYPDQPVCLGSHGRLCNAGSFHDPFSRFVREAILCGLAPHLQGYVAAQDTIIAGIGVLMDHHVYRPVGTAASSTTTDATVELSPGLRPGERVLRCVLNVGEAPIKVIVYKGTHAAGPFTYWSRPSTTAKAMVSILGMEPVEVVAEPGQCIVFHPSMVHKMHWPSTKDRGDFRLQSTLLLTPFLETPYSTPASIFDMTVPPIRTEEAPWRPPGTKDSAPTVNLRDVYSPYSAFERDVFLPAARHYLRCFRTPDDYTEQMLVK